MTAVPRSLPYLFSAYCLLGCSAPGDAPAPSLSRVQLPAGEAARVGSEHVALLSVQRVADTQRVSLAVARDRATRDAVLALGARAAFEGGSIVQVAERAAFARALLELFKAEALARGPATDAELSDLTALRWQDFDRPETVRTTHAVARVDKPESEAAAKAVAQQLFEAVRGSQGSEEFMRRAQTVPHEGVEVRVERLPAITRDGRVYYPDNPPPDSGSQHFDEAFAAAVHQLTAGQISEPLKTVFGYHVVFCEARLPPLRVPLEERRQLLAGEVIKGRAERAKQALLGELSRAKPILIARAAEDLTARVQVRE